MNGRIVTDEDLSKALDWLRDNAPMIGDAKGRLVAAGHMLKHVEALEYMKAEGSAETRKSVARASQRYLEAIYEEAAAAAEFETMRARREAAALKIESWRSEQANYRSMKV